MDLFNRVRDVASVSLVSNGTTRLEQDLAGQGLDGLARTVVNTARIGVAKPSPRVYCIAAARVGATAERCLFIHLFIHDTQANVTAARDAGMAAHHYRDLDELRMTLAPLAEPVARVGLSARCVGPPAFEKVDVETWVPIDAVTFLEGVTSRGSRR
ncbi:HAD-IA family hydrolase [Streptomyces sp. NPDC001340]